MPSKKVLITGATGLLGSNVAAELVERGFQVRALLRKSSNTIAIHDIPCEKYYGDITNAQSVSEAVEGCDFVIHSAANTSQWGADMTAHDSVNVLGTQYVIKAVKTHNIRRFIHVSTANTMRPGSLNQPGNEQHSFSYGDSATKYIATKHEAEQLVLDAANQGVPALVVNPTFMIGPRDAKPSSGKMILYYMRNPLIVCPSGGKNFVPVRDAAVAIANALEQGQIGARYLLAGANLDYETFFEMVAEATGSGKPTLTAPGWLLKGIGRIGDVIQYFTREPISFTYANTSLLTIDNFYTASKAIRELDMPQTPINKGIQEAVEWFTRHEYLK